MGKLRVYGSPENISVGKNCCLHDGVMLNAYKKGFIKIKNNVVLSPDVKILATSLTLKTIHEDRTHIGRSVVLGDNVWVATGAVILGGVTIGGGSIVGAGSVVTHSFGEKLLICGNPAKVVRRLE